MPVSSARGGGRLATGRSERESADFPHEEEKVEGGWKTEATAAASSEVSDAERRVPFFLRTRSANVGGWNTYTTHTYTHMHIHP